MKLPNTKIQSREKDNIVDAILFSTLFYLLSHKSTYEMTKPILSTWLDDRILLHTLMFGVIYLMIQKITKRM